MLANENGDILNGCMIVIICAIAGAIGWALAFVVMERGPLATCAAALCGAVVSAFLGACLYYAVGNWFDWWN